MHAAIAEVGFGRVGALGGRRTRVPEYLSSEFDRVFGFVFYFFVVAAFHGLHLKNGYQGPDPRSRGRVL